MLSLFSIISKLLTLFFRIDSKHNNSVINNIVQEIRTAVHGESNTRYVSSKPFLPAIEEECPNVSFLLYIFCCYIYKMKKEVGMLLQKRTDTSAVGIYKLYEENTH